MQEIVLERGKIHQNRFGAFHHEDIIGKPWGSKVCIMISIPYFVHVVVERLLLGEAKSSHTRFGHHQSYGPCVASTEHRSYIQQILE